MEPEILSEEEEALAPRSPQPIHASELVKNENQTLINLISLYEQNRCLWDKTDEGFANRTAREDAWAAVFEYYKRVVEKPDIKKMKNMFTNLRSCWRREYKNSAHKTPKLWYFEHLNFLAAGGVGREGIDVDQSVSESESLNETQDQRCQPKKKKVEVLRAQAAVLEAAKKIMASPDDENEWVTQGKLWGQRLSAMDPEQRTIAAKLMADVMYFGDSKLLTHGASVTPGYRPHNTAPTGNTPYRR